MRSQAARPGWSGNDLSLGDINVMPFVARLDYLAMLDVWIGDRPNVQRWWRTARRRYQVFARRSVDRLTAPGDRGDAKRPEQESANTSAASGRNISRRRMPGRRDALRGQTISDSEEADA